MWSLQPLIVHRLTNYHDQEVVKRAVGTMDQRSASFLPTLSQGEALLLKFVVKSRVAEYLEIPDEYVEEFDSLDIDYSSLRYL